MPNLITAKLDVTKIEKARLFPGKNGAKYLDIVLIPTTDDRYGNTHMVVQAVTKEEREAGTRGPILGNAKQLDSRSEGRQPARRETKRNIPEQNLDEDVPF